MDSSTHSGEGVLAGETNRTVSPGRTLGARSAPPSSHWLVFMWTSASISVVASLKVRGMLTPGVELDITVGSARLRARRWGSSSARPVLGLPGLAGNVENFAFLAERIAGPDLQLIALDLRGRGHSDITPAGTYGWENHGRDVLAAADTLGFDRFALIGQSMGGSVAMKAAELDRSRLAAVVLVDIAGRVDRGVGPVVEASLARVGAVYASAEAYVAEVRASGLIDPWTSYWERAYRYDLEAHEGGVRTRTSPQAVAEDRAYTATQDPYTRWANLTMPTLLIRAAHELIPGAGHVVPVEDARPSAEPSTPGGRGRRQPPDGQHPHRHRRRGTQVPHRERVVQAAGSGWWRSSPPRGLTGLDALGGDEVELEVTAAVR